MNKKIKEWFLTGWGALRRNELFMRAFHTFWQVFGGHILMSLIAAHSSADVKLALTGAFAAALSALKTLLVGYLSGSSAS